MERGGRRLLRAHSGAACEHADDPENSLTRQGIDCGGASCRGNDEKSAVRGRRRGAFRPPCLNLAEPFAELLTEVPLLTVLYRSQLLSQSGASEERYASQSAFLKTPTSPNEPHIKVKGAGSIGQGRYHSAFDGNPVAVDLIVEGLAQRDCVVSFLMIGFCRRITVVPELNAIKLCDVCNYVV